MSCPYGHHLKKDDEKSDDTTSPKELTRRQSEERFREAKEIRLHEPLYYGEYLQVPKLLSCQTLKSQEHGVNAHDEHLFVIIHQTYELWFKQILHELRSVTSIFKQSKIAECDIFKAVSRLRRVVEIQRVLVSQLTILETMTPLGFLEFRDFLFPASGFQSVQWRMIENLLGLQRKQRVQYGHRQYCSYLNDQDAKVVKAVESEPSMHDLVEKWLERTPYLSSKEFNFWDHYRKAVESMLEKDRQSIKKNTKISQEKKDIQLQEIEVSAQHFRSLFDKESHDAMKEKGHRRLSQKAMQAALFITLYQDEPILHMPFQLLNTLLEIDECMTLWRYRHSLMVHRMIGARIGTGGSSGFHYLKSTATRHRIFKDFFNLSTFLIPRVTMPELPQSVKSVLAFSHEDN